MKAIICICISSALILSCLALDCPECDRSLCKDIGQCRFGRTLDVCACCPECYKGIGEECGGPWEVKGKCARHLTCVRLPGDVEKDPIKEFNAVGKCLALP